MVFKDSSGSGSGVRMRWSWSTSVLNSSDLSKLLTWIVAAGKPWQQNTTTEHQHSNLSLMLAWWITPRLMPCSITLTFCLGQWLLRLDICCGEQRAFNSYRVMNKANIGFRVDSSGLTIYLDRGVVTTDLGRNGLLLMCKEFLL